MSITIRKTARIRRRRRTDLVSRIAIPSAILALGYVAFVLVSDILTPPTVTIQAQMPTPVPAPVVIAKAEPYSTLLDPGYSLGAPAQTLVQAPPPAIEPGPAAIEPEAPTPSVVEIEPDPEQVAPTVQLALSGRLGQKLFGVVAGDQALVELPGLAGAPRGKDR
jgi:hypothetical protein